MLYFCGAVVADVAISDSWSIVSSRAKRARGPCGRIIDVEFASLGLGIQAPNVTDVAAIRKCDLTYPAVNWIVGKSELLPIRLDNRGHNLHSDVSWAHCTGGGRLEISERN